MSKPWATTASPGNYDQPSPKWDAGTIVAPGALPIVDWIRQENREPLARGLTFLE
ncbi:hypothetical protein HYR99_24360 [Candidatus Poribacteria bacterium]|nr:hypothetical protein [Candidatus Poribacteria bacterium]